MRNEQESRSKKIWRRNLILSIISLAVSIIVLILSLLPDL